MLITEIKPLKTGGMSIYPYSVELEAAFRFKPKYEDEMSMALHVGNTLHVPRGLVPIGIEDNRVYKKPIAINCKNPPRNDDQAQVINSSVELLKQGTDHIINAPTGFGKSYCGAAIACQMGQPTLIIVTKEDLVVSWRKCLVDLIGIPESEIGHIQQEVCNYKGKRFVIAMIHSLVVEGKYSDEMFNYFGMVIFEEVHNLGATTFVRACQVFPAAIRLGISATTGRSDGKWCMIEAHIGPVMVEGTAIPMSPKVLVKKTGWKIPHEWRWVDDEEGGGKVRKFLPLKHSAGRMMTVYAAMGEDLARNAKIVQFVKSAYKADRIVVVLSDLIDGHLKKLFFMIAEVVPAEEISYYVGGLTEKQRDIAKKKRVILATYKMCSEGTDVPEWDTLVLATPRAKVKQSAGRVTRSKDGKKTPVILDLVDDGSIFSAYYQSREKEYYSVKATIVKMKESS